MHDLALCAVHVDGEVVVDGFVLEFGGDLLTVATSELAVGLTPGDDVTVRVLDEVRGECLYAGFVSRVAADQVDVADLGLVSTLQKREVVRVRVAIPCRGTVVPHGAVSVLEAAGVGAVHTLGICTAEDDRFYSYRRSGVTGRFAGVVMLDRDE